MALDYFYGSQADQFAFYRIPKALFRGVYKSASMEAKLLYGLMLDRMELSARNKWLDDEGRVYIIYSIEEIMDAMGYGNQKVAKLLNELERDCGLIERRRLGMGKANIIYVKNFIDSSADDEETDIPKSHDKKCENHISRDVKNTYQEVCKSHGNNTYINKTDINNTEFSPPNNPPTGDEGAREEKKRGALSKEERERLTQELEDKLQSEQLKAERPKQAQDIDQFFEVSRRAVCSGRTYQRIGGEEIPTESIKSVLLSLEKEQFGAVLDAWEDNADKVKNPRQYMLAMLYNAPISTTKPKPKRNSGSFEQQIDHEKLKALVASI